MGGYDGRKWTFAQARIAWDTTYKPTKLYECDAHTNTKKNEKCSYAMNIGRNAGSGTLPPDSPPAGTGRLRGFRSDVVHQNHPS